MHKNKLINHVAKKRGKYSGKELNQYLSEEERFENSIFEKKKKK